ncbi:Protein-lysine methyltransferase METTL21E [Grifola frondosa]|uniref:Protein-lysine methyltransferase METTL21E n=1 Tax=Grifola frondosa TaxID=5627 RepID=A0A1C7MGT1_GRIFR|nr:Protein-lysine methyltransferase METTL21E [Grifola frondosa]
MLFSRPAHQTKHLPLLDYNFRDFCLHLAQLDDGVTNGSALWLGAQCLTLYLFEVLKIKSSRTAAGNRPKAIELGSGIGLSALALSAMGWDVIATDLPEVISSVLSNNISRNLSQLPDGCGTIQVRILNWAVSPDQWVWDNDRVIGSPSPQFPSEATAEGERLQPPFDLIISSDTLYSRALVQPLLRTLHSLCMLSVNSSSPPRSPVVYLCVERRDPVLIDQALSDAKTKWNFDVERVPHKKVAKAMAKGGIKWEREDWDGVEIWKLSLRRENENTNHLPVPSGRDNHA